MVTGDDRSKAGGQSQDMGVSQIKVGITEPRTASQDSRDEILKAAMQLFANRGFHETSMSEVAREAHVSKALIFWHFKTKEELFVAVLNRLLEPYFIDFAEEAAAMDERQQIQKLVEAYLLFVRDNASSVRFFLAQMLHEQRLSEGLNEQVLRLYSGYRAMLVELIARGAAEERLQAADVAGIGGGVPVVGTEWIADRVLVYGRECDRPRRGGGDGGRVVVRSVGDIFIRGRRTVRLTFPSTSTGADICVFR